MKFARFVFFSFSMWMSVSPAIAAQAGPKTQQYVNQVVGTTSATLDFAPFSAEKIGSADYRRCVSDDQSSAEESFCLRDEFKLQDARLNAILDRMLRQSEPSQRALIIKAQAVWKQFRTANCAIRRSVAGSGAAIFYEGCLVRETNQLIAELLGRWDY